MEAPERVVPRILDRAPTTAVSTHVPNLAVRLSPRQNAAQNSVWVLFGCFGTSRGCVWDFHRNLSASTQNELIWTRDFPCFVKNGIWEGKHRQISIFIAGFPLFPKKNNSDVAWTKMAMKLSGVDAK